MYWCVVCPKGLALRIAKWETTKGADRTFDPEVGLSRSDSPTTFEWLQNRAERKRAKRQDSPPAGMSVSLAPKANRTESVEIPFEEPTSVSFLATES